MGSQEAGVDLGRRGLLGGAIKAVIGAVAVAVGGTLIGYVLGMGGTAGPDLSAEGLQHDKDLIAKFLENPSVVLPKSRMPAHPMPPMSGTASRATWRRSRAASWLVARRLKPARHCTTSTDARHVTRSEAPAAISVRP